MHECLDRCAQGLRHTIGTRTLTCFLCNAWLQAKFTRGFSSTTLVGQVQPYVRLQPLPIM